MVAGHNKKGGSTPQDVWTNIFCSPDELNEGPFLGDGEFWSIVSPDSSGCTPVTSKDDCLASEYK